MGSALLAFEQPSYEPRLARSTWFLGGLFTFHTTAAETAGQFALVEITGSPGAEPPMHVHHREDECFYVIEGRLKLYLGEEELVLEPGESAFLPRNVPHTFRILSSRARWLNYISPAGFEEYFRTLGEPARELKPPKTPKPPDIPRMVKEAKKFGLEFLP